jgi:SNF2 family DNA or RNA helicase
MVPALAPHQRDAVVRAQAVVASRGGVLLADEVGMGKSFVAAEILRGFEGRKEVVVPAALVAQWTKTLAEFDLADVRVLTHDGIVRDPLVPQPVAHLVVVDEAHAFRNPKTQRYAALARRLAAARAVLVTATPVCNSLRDLEALVALLARDDLLADCGVPSIDVAFESRDRELVGRIVEALVIRRNRSVLPDELQFGALRREVVRHAVPPIEAIGRLAFPLVGEHAILRRFLRRRLESSEAALIESVRRQLRFYERALDAVAAGRTLPKRDYRRAFAHEEDRDAFQDVLFWELFAQPGEADPSAIRAEMALLDEVLAAARASPAAKRPALLDLVRGEGEPILIFTGSAATARDLHAALQPLRRTGLITSRERSREEVLDRFRDGFLDVIVSTDMAAEGLNLQRAGAVIHYDIPWNPVKLDQRNGRAHRIGQPRSEVRAIYFVPESRETRIMEVVARKNRTRRRALHASVELTPPGSTTLRPRLTSSAAYAELRAAAGLQLPDFLARRHKAGLERLMFEMSREYLDARRLDDLVELVRCEA